MATIRACRPAHICLFTTSGTEGLLRGLCSTVWAEFEISLQVIFAVLTNHPFYSPFKAILTISPRNLGENKSPILLLYNGYAHP
jgi:hypothetical protein